MSVNQNLTDIFVSVVIVSWNAKDYLRKCLLSLSSGVCHFPMEIIVVDNASSDGSPDCVEFEFPHVRLIRNTENMGFAKANNIGVSFCSGNYLCFINSDVEVLPDCISHLVEYCEKHPEAGMVGPLIIGGDGQLQRSCRGFPSFGNMFCRALALDKVFKNYKLFTGYSLSHWPQDTVLSVDILTGCFWLVRRRAMEQVGLLDEDFFIYGEDMDWCKRFWEKDWQVVFVPSAKAIHYGGASSSNAPLRFYIERQKADLQYWKKHHSEFAVEFYLLITCLHMLVRLVGYSFLLLFNYRGQIEQYKVKRSWACLKWIFSHILGAKRQSQSVQIPS
jgi:GT2 family glycosyltransferase